MGKRKPRPLYPPHIDSGGRDAITRLVDEDFEGVDWESVTYCRFRDQPDITRLPPLGRALVELELDGCTALASLAGIENCVGLTTLKLTSLDAAMLATELARLAELPDLAHVTLSFLRGASLDALRALADLPGLIQLELGSCDIDQAAAFVEIGKSPTLRRLKLEWYEPWKLVDALAPLAELRSLELEACVEVPKSIGALAKLEHLRIVGERYKQRTKLRRLPAAIGACASLKQLVVIGPVTAIPDEICALARLEELSLLDGHFTRLPDAIGRLTRLRSLSITGRGLEALPDSIGDLAELRKLHLPYLGEYTVPDTIERLALEEFNGPAAIDARIPRRPPPTPESDDVKLADIERIPDDFGDPRKLELRLGAYRGTLPQLRKLRRLNDATLEVGDLADALSGLAHLDHLDMLRLSSVETLPVAIGELRCLKTLSVEGELTALPDALGELDNLEWLIVDAPRLTALPDAIANLPKLRQVSIYAAAFARFPDALVRVESLYVCGWTPSANDAARFGELRSLTQLTLRELPPAFAKVLEALAKTPIEVLLVETDDLVTLPPAIGGLATLISLDLQRTRVRKLPVEIQQCTALESITLPKPEFVGDPREQLPPGKWSKKEWAGLVRCERSKRGA